MQVQFRGFNPVGCNPVRVQFRGFNPVGFNPVWVQSRGYRSRASYLGDGGTPRTDTTSIAGTPRLGILLKVAKTRFFQHYMEYLGYVVTEEGIHLTLLSPGLCPPHLENQKGLGAGQLDNRHAGPVQHVEGTLLL